MGRQVRIREMDVNEWIAFAPFPPDIDADEAFRFFAIGATPVDAFAALVGKCPELAQEQEAAA